MMNEKKWFLHLLSKQSDSKLHSIPNKPNPSLSQDSQFLLLVPPSILLSVDLNYLHSENILDFEFGGGSDYVFYYSID